MGGDCLKQPCRSMGDRSEPTPADPGADGETIRESPLAIACTADIFGDRRSMENVLAWREAAEHQKTPP
jgi:hypothetical protein